MNPRIVTRALQLTPYFVTGISLLIGLVLSLYWWRAKHPEQLLHPSRQWLDDPENLLLAGLLLMAAAVLVCFVALWC